MTKARWLLPILLAAPLFAVTPSFWEVRSYEDFQKGKLSNLSLTNDDRLILAPRYDMVFDTQQTLIASAVADSKGNVYLGTGHDGKIYKVDPSGKGAQVADLNELDIFALAVDSKDVLYAGASPNGKVYKIEPGGSPTEFFDPGTKYIWAMAFDKQGRLLVGTGDKGVIYRVGSDGKGAPFYDTDETHIVSLAVDRDGNVIAGGDPKGYLYRISPEGKAFVLYDSGLREVHAVSIGTDGRIFAAVLNGEPGSSPSMTAPRQSSPANPSGVEGGGITITIGESASVAAQTVEITSDQAGVDVVPPSASGSSSNRGPGTGPAQSVILEVVPGNNNTVNTLWRLKDEMVYSILPHGGRLLFSTGTKGRIYSIDDARNTTLLVESTEEQTTRLIEVGNRVYATSANTGKLFGLSDATASSGSYESVVRDTNAVSTWGTMSWKAENPGQIQFLTRTGNTGVPDKTWSDWSPVPASGAVASPPARFAQWKAVLTSAANRPGPALDSVTLPYLQQNFRPELTSVEVLPPGVALAKVPPITSSGAPAPTDPALIRANVRAGLQPAVKPPPRRSVERGAQSFRWTATDRNQDTLAYDVYYRGDSERTWRLLKKDLEDNFYTINSDTLPDGTYILRVVASDSPSNPPKGALTAELESRPFSIDNTPPAVRIQQRAIAGGRVSVAIDASDATSTLNQAEISVDTGPWQALFPADGITDSKTETYSYQSEILSAGEHVIAFRTYDQNDNVGIGKLVVRIP